jgi:HEAT repeat protein
LNTLNKALSSPDQTTRLAAIEVLDSLALDAAALDEVNIIGALSDEYLWVRRTALRILNRIGPVKAEKIVPAVIPMIRNDQDNELAKPLATLLSKYGAKAAPAVPALTKAIAGGGGDPDTRISFLQTLSAIGPDAKSAIPAIGQILKPIDANLNVQTPGSPPPYIPPTPVKYDNVSVRAAAANALGSFGALAKEAEPSLQAALIDPDADLRKAASEALLRIRGK